MVEATGSHGSHECVDLVGVLKFPRQGCRGYQRLPSTLRHHVAASRLQDRACSGYRRVRDGSSPTGREGQGDVEAVADTRLRVVVVALVPALPLLAHEQKITVMLE